MLGNRLPTMRLVLTTCADQAGAEQLARQLLGQRLAACVSLLPVTSYYHWQGELQNEREVQLVIKTSADQLSNLLETLTCHHSYEVPELVVLEAGAAGSYGAWLLNAVGSPSDARDASHATALSGAPGPTEAVPGGEGGAGRRLAEAPGG